jgi:Amylo-alpha-1,6-glucosidase
MTAEARVLHRPAPWREGPPPTPTRRRGPDSSASGWAHIIDHHVRGTRFGTGLDLEAGRAQRPLVRRAVRDGGVGRARARRPRGGAALRRAGRARARVVQRPVLERARRGARRPRRRRRRRGRRAPARPAVRDLAAAPGARSRVLEGGGRRRARAAGDAVRAAHDRARSGHGVPWLVGAFADAWRRVYPERLEELRPIASSLAQHLASACVGTIGERFEAAPPFTPRGCGARASNVAGLIRLRITLAPSPARRRWRRTAADGGAPRRTPPPATATPARR